jgi:ribonuclease HI
MPTVFLAIDGAAKGNPGAAGIGVVICDEEGRALLEMGEYIGETTNNVAEYTALIRGLEEASKLRATSIVIQTDSQLLERQIRGIYRVKSPHLAELYQRAIGLLVGFDDAKMGHVPREQNARADKLASESAKRRANCSGRSLRGKTGSAGKLDKPAGDGHPPPRRQPRLPGLD